jgi:hypothetical protein
MPSRWLRRNPSPRSGRVRLETLLLIAAVALPILLFLFKTGWPRLREILSP